METQSNEKASVSANPLGEEVVVEVAMPKSFKIKMVDASNLNDFRIWSAIFSILMNVFVGFLVATITNVEPLRQKLLIWITIVWGILALGALIMTLWKNHTMQTNETVINLKASK